jgi:hypothetical protein
VVYDTLQKTASPYDISPVSRRITTQIFEPLIDLNSTLETELLLADTIHVISPTTVEIAIKKGIHFSNGDMLTASDVVFAWTDMLDHMTIEQKKHFEPVVSLKEKENKIFKETKNLEWKKRKQSLIKEIRRKIFENIKFLLPIIGGRKFSLKTLKGEPSFEDQRYWQVMLSWKIAESLIIECKSDSDNRWFVPKTNRGFVECFVINKKREIISHIKLWFTDNKISTFEKFPVSWKP